MLFRSEEYERLLEKAFSSESPLPFSNKSALHARVVMKLIIKYATKDVCLYSSELKSSYPEEGFSEDVEVYAWGELAGAVESFIKNPSARLRIKVKSPKPAEEVLTKNLIVGLSEEYPEQIQIEWNKPSDMKDFMVSDFGAFRFEFDKHRATACAKNEDVASKLTEVFELL